MLRRTLGGFGMMYMRSVLNFSTQGLTYGNQERVALDEQLYGAASQLTGFAMMPRNQQQVLANRRALMGTDVSAISGIQGYMQGTPGRADIYNAATAGLGAFATATWMGSMMPGGDKSLIARGAPVIGATMAAASFAGNVAQKTN